MAQDIYSKYQQPVSAPGASADADIYSRYQRPDSGTPPDAGAQMRQSAINKIPAELSGFQPRSSRIFHTGIPNIDRPDTASPPIPAFDQSPATQMAHGFERAAEPGFDNKAAGASGMIRGLGRAAAGGALPLLGAGLATAPLATIGGAAVGSAGAYGGGKLARLGAQKLGGGEGAQDLAQDVGEGVGGAVVAPALLKTIGKGVQAPAVPIAETALGVRGADRAYNAAPGKAALNETTGFSPRSVQDSAQNRISLLNDRLENNARDVHQPGGSGSLAPARKVVSGAIGNAKAGNAAGEAKELHPMDAFLNKPIDGFAGNTDPGIPNKYGPTRIISERQDAQTLLRMKRKFGTEFVDNWNPAVSGKGTLATAKNGYHALDQELDNAVPGSSLINQRIANLIPVAKRAEATDANAGSLQKILARFARPTGALVGGVTGAIEGGQHFGIPGAIGGGLAGLGIPELLSSPTAQMLAARGLNATGNSLRTPETVAASRLIPLLTSSREKENKR